MNTVSSTVMSRNLVSSCRSASLESANAVEKDDHKVEELRARSQDNGVLAAMKNENEQLKNGKKMQSLFVC